MPRVIDYAWARPTVAQLRAEGTATNPVIGIMRYLSYDTSKNLSPAEYTTMKNAGLKVGLVWETTANRALSGYDGGLADARKATEQANALSFPGAIYFAVDFDATTAQMPTVLAYLKGANAGTPKKLGVYGSYRVLQAVGAAQAADYYWQTSAWSGTSLSPYRDLYQHIYKSSLDVNEVVDADWGQDFPPSTFPQFPLPLDRYFGYGDVMVDDRFKVWQQRMKDRGWVIVADGLFGNQSYTVAKAFQRDKGLTEDGKVGRTTWNAAWKSPVT